MPLKCYTDAAVNGNPGQGGIGFIIQGQGVYHQIALPLEGEWNNHLAEFEALLQALLWLKEHSYTDTFLFLYTDSKILADSLMKRYARQTAFSDYTEKILTLCESFTYWEIKWIPESQNKGAN